jgi:cell division protein FtsB
MGAAKLKTDRRDHIRAAVDQGDAGQKMLALLKRHGRALLGLVLLLLVVHDIFGTHGYLAMRRKQNEIKKVNANIEKLNKENAQLQEEVHELKTDPHKIEKIARDELGLAKPGEIIIKIPQSQQLPDDSTGKP